MKELFQSVFKLKEEFDKKRNKDRFNIITALHKERDEENLHSRFISYLLSKDSGHGMKDTYFRIFLRNVLKLSEKDFSLSSYIVYPNELKKSEYKEIDILIVNKLRDQAIIIENKIDAKDSNNDSKMDGYKGQLERYYNTIRKGIDKDGNSVTEHQCNNVYVYYLSNDKTPTDFSIGMLKNEPNSWQEKNIISYSIHIREWLAKCIENTPDEKKILKEFITHYLKLINRITNNDIPITERMELKNIIAENIESYKYIIENFKHVKWHTVNNFWLKLKSEIEKKYSNVVFFTESDLDFSKAIGEITHNHKDINIGILFDLKNGTKSYISCLGNLSWGILDPKMWSDFKDSSLENINFSEFSSDNSYQLINDVKMNKIVFLIVNEIAEAETTNLNNLQPLY